MLLKILSMPTRQSPNEPGVSTHGTDVSPVPSAWLREPAWIPSSPCERHEFFVYGDAFLHIKSGIIHTPFLLSPQNPPRKPKNLLRHSVVTLINLVWFLAIRQSRYGKANQQSLFKCWIWLSQCMFWVCRPISSVPSLRGTSHLEFSISKDVAESHGREDKVTET